MSPRIKALPTFEALKNAYPNDPTPLDIAQKVGGRVKSNLESPAMPEYKNTCCIRVSRALNYAGQPIKPHINGVRVNSGGDGKWYVYAVGDLRRYLTAIYGPPDLVKSSETAGGVSAADVDGEQGIIEFDNYHMDLWDRSNAVHAAYFYHVKAVRIWRAPGVVGGGGTAAGQSTT